MWQLQRMMTERSSENRSTLCVLKSGGMPAGSALGVGLTYAALGAHVKSYFC